MSTTSSVSQHLPRSLRSTILVALLAAGVALATGSVSAQMARTADAPGRGAAEAKPALDDPTIVAIFDAANTWDMETAGIALQKSRNKDVREFARMMAHDHRAVRKLGRDLAKKLKVTPTPPGKDFAMYQDHLKAVKMLRATKRGAAFDKAYIDHEVAYHQAVIDAITNTLLPATQNAELKNLETTVAPNFQAHLLAAQKVQEKLMAAK